ncbi:CDP-glycerol glycerophosphotransferase family protein [Priestia megaterium]|uniref:CDP-glycerol glycerophosphotransferase family protein n=1 Tax=Priestia megaterium TaxID=1404 RepID=UPI0030F3DD4D
MENIYLKNYWLLNLEFIEAFSSLEYGGLPLPLLSNFYKYIDDKLKEEMMDVSFGSDLCSKEVEKKKIQIQFERWLTPLRNPSNKKQVSGKILLNFDYLRFSINNFLQFDSTKTLLLSRSKVKKMYNIPVISEPDYIKNNQRITDIIIEKARDIFNSLNPNSAFNNSFFMKSFLSDIPIMIEKINMINLIFDKNPIISVVVGTTEDITSRVLTLIASKRGIPSFCMQHGLIMREEAFLPVFATKQVVYGQYEKKLYLQRGVEENKIEIVGNPRFDDIFNNRYMERIKFLRRMKINLNKKIVLIATQQFNTSFYTKLATLLIQDPEIVVIIKPHPWEQLNNQIQKYIKLSKLYPSIKCITNQMKTYDIIANSDVVVIVNSTIGLESMLLDKPVICCNLKSLDRNYPYYEELDCLVTQDVQTTLKTVQKVLYHKISPQTTKQLRNQFLKYNYPQVIALPKLKKLINMMT